MRQNYECKYCKRNFPQKFNLDRHLNKKNPCKTNPQKILNNPKNDENEEIDNKSYKSTDSNSIKEDINTILCKEILGIEKIPMITNGSEEQDKIICGYCQGFFLNKSNLNKHIKNNCKVKKQQDEVKENIFKKLLEQENMLKKKDEQIDKLLTQNGDLLQKNDILFNKIVALEGKVDKIAKTNKSTKISNSNSHNTNNNTINANTNTTNMTNTNSNNVVFNLVNYGKEDLDKIDIKYFMDNVVKNNKAIGVKIPEEILKIIHFNPDYPEHNNIYISDINREKCMVYEDNQWKLTPEDKIPEVMDKVVQYSYTKQDELKEKYPNNKSLSDRLGVVNKYTQFLDLDFLEGLKEIYIEENSFNPNSSQIKRCEDFQKKAYNSFKTTMYNEGIKIKRNQKK